MNSIFFYFPIAPLVFLIIASLRAVRRAGVVHVFGRVGDIVLGPCWRYWGPVGDIGVQEHGKCMKKSDLGAPLGTLFETFFVILRPS